MFPSYRRPILSYLIQAKHQPRSVKNANEVKRAYIRAKAAMNVAREPAEICVHQLKQEVKLQKLEQRGRQQSWIPSARGVLRNFFSQVKAAYFAGGGGAGRAYPATLMEAKQFGMNFNNIDILNATSVGTIQALVMALGASAAEAKELLLKMPTESFQDWDLKSILTFHHRWGFCRGESMGAYFRDLIKYKTGLDDPTFQELFDAGFCKKFRVIMTNVTTRELKVFSYKTTPNRKVAEIVAAACHVPILFPPLRLEEDGHINFYTDGGLVLNYPYGKGIDPNMPLNQQIGFMFQNAPEALSLKDSDGRSIMSSIWHYIYSMIWIMLFQTPMSLPDVVRHRTVNIKVGDHNVFNFNADQEQQEKKLDYPGRAAIRQLVKESAEHSLKTLKKQTSTQPHKCGHTLLYHMMCHRASKRHSTITNDNDLSHYSTLRHVVK